MTYLYCVYLLTLVGLLVAGVMEQRRHERNLRAMPVRILVNGIRGKSSVTRLVAGALRGGGLRVVAKTTGSAARFIYPDGTEVPVHRKFGIANVIEQIGIVTRAAAEEPDVLVIECMAVLPALQEVNQTKLVKSTLGVLTNVREDHLEEMGPSLEDVARSLSRSLPVGGTCVTAERQQLAVLREEADARDCSLVVADSASVTEAEMERFEHFTFKDNVAIALAVAARLGVSRDCALRGMWTANPDPGALRVDTYHLGDAEMKFANVFAANDPQSTLLNYQQLRDRGQIGPPIFTLINCRPDRIERNAQMGELVEMLDTTKLFLIGHPTRSARDAVPPSWSGPVVDLGGLQRTAEEIFRTMAVETSGGGSVVAIGNIHGQGELLLEYLETLGELR